MKRASIDIFFQLLRYSIGASEEFPSELSPEMWNDIYKIARQQSLLGVLFYGIQQQTESKPPRDLLLKWYAISEQIRKANEKTNQVACELTRNLWTDGFRSCILKGQGNTLNYPNPYIRTSGDIDIWVKPVDSGLLTVDNYLKSVLLYVRSKNPKAKACYHHIDAGVYQDVEVEIHYRPSFMNNLIYNRRLQRWFAEQAEEQFSHEVELPDGVGKVCVPTNSFNIIYQLAHIYNHVIHEGIGLRQLVDYYFLLKSKNDNGFQTTNNGELAVTLKHLGLYKFAGAVMWVQKETLGLEDECLIVPPNEKLGQILLNEILQGGNFGQYDARVKRDGSQLSRNIQRLKRDLRLLRYFPSECLWEPVFRIYHFFWRVAHR